MNSLILNRESFEMPADGRYQIAPTGEFPHSGAGVVLVVDRAAEPPCALQTPCKLPACPQRTERLVLPNTMNPDLPQPEWAPQKPYESLLEAARWLHTQAVDTFLADKTHVNVLFLFSCDNGLISVNPLPPGVTDEQMLGGVRQAIQEHDLYAVITIAETWTYFSSGSGDHTLVQIMHNEMRVSDLRDEDKAECLMVRMECREGEGFAWINKIARAGDDITLGSTITFPLDKTLKQHRFFGRDYTG